MKARKQRRGQSEETTTMQALRSQVAEVPRAPQRARFAVVVVPPRRLFFLLLLPRSHHPPPLHASSRVPNTNDRPCAFSKADRSVRFDLFVAFALPFPLFSSTLAHACSRVPASLLSLVSLLSSSLLDRLRRPFPSRSLLPPPPHPPKSPPHMPPSFLGAPPPPVRPHPPAAAFHTISATRIAAKKKGERKRGLGVGVENGRGKRTCS